jgi:hypothetical protein
MKTLREYIDQLDEISRRDFLKGAGATAGLAATDAISAPFKHGQHKDELENKLTDKYSTVRSDNGDAVLYIGWNKGVTLNVSGKRFERTGSAFGRPSSLARIKFGSEPAEGIAIILDKDYKIGTLINKADPTYLAKKIISYNGPLKIEANIASLGSKIFSFTIEQDSVTKNIREEEVDETATPDAVARIEELIKYK